MANDLDDRIHAYCERRGWRFRPFDIEPADVRNGPSPYPPGSAGSISWPKAQRLRRQIIAALKAEDG